MNVHRIVEIAKCARNNNGLGPLSTGEALTAALVLNRSDWLNAMDYTIVEALDRIDQDTIRHLRKAERMLASEGQP